MCIVVENQIKLHRWALWLIVKKLTKAIHIENYVIAGSYRRGNWWCNDIDLLIPVANEIESKGIQENIKKLGWKLRERIEGDPFSIQYTKETLGGTLVLDLFLATPGTWGNALLFTTGPKEFNDVLRNHMIDIGYSWHNPKYFKHTVKQTQISFSNEKAALTFLDIKYIQPNKRYQYGQVHKFVD